MKIGILNIKTSLCKNASYFIICKNFTNRTTNLENQSKNIINRFLVSNINFSHKNFFYVFRKLNIRSKNELITHPELGGEQILNSGGSGMNFNIHEINKDDCDEDYEEDETLNFISLDKNGVPVIKNNYYEILGVKQTASPKEIRINFLKIAKKYHPDKHPQSLVMKNFNLNIF